MVLFFSVFVAMKDAVAVALANAGGVFQHMRLRPIENAFAIHRPQHILTPETLKICIHCPSPVASFGNTM